MGRISTIYKHVKEVPTALFFVTQTLATYVKMGSIQEVWLFLSARVQIWKMLD